MVNGLCKALHLPTTFPPQTIEFKRAPLWRHACIHVRDMRAQVNARRSIDRIPYNAFYYCKLVRLRVPVEAVAEALTGADFLVAGSSAYYHTALNSSRSC